MRTLISSTRTLPSIGRLPRFGGAVILTAATLSLGLVGCEMEETSNVDLRRSAANDEMTTDRDPNPSPADENGDDAGSAPAQDGGSSATADATAPGAPDPNAYKEGDTLRTTADLNLRSGAGTEHGVLVTMPTGAVVALVAAAPTNGFYNVKYASLTGWASAKYLVAAPGAVVDEHPVQEIITPVPVRPHVQAFANVACGTVGCPDVVSSYHGHQPSVDLALDVFQLRELGDKFADFALGDKVHRLEYVIWRQRINTRDGRGWRMMEDRGSITQNHYDHVHVSFNP